MFHCWKGEYCRSPRLHWLKTSNFQEQQLVGSGRLNSKMVVGEIIMLGLVMKVTYGDDVNVSARTLAELYLWSAI